MKQLVTTGIVLARTDYGEADRILTLLTPDLGKVRVIAKGVRRIKSKLAGGIELFSVSNISYITNTRGRSELGTLVSSRLIKHYGTIVQDINRTMLGYDLIKRLNKATEDEPEPEYFELLQQGFEALDDAAIGLSLIQLWFAMQLLRIGGHTPNLQTDTAGSKLTADQSYNFSFDDMSFATAPTDARDNKQGDGGKGQGRFSANQIKFLRLGFAGHQPKALTHIQDSEMVVDELMPLVQTMLQTHVRT